MNKNVFSYRDELIIIDLLLSIGYIFFINFYNYVNVPQSVLSILSVVRLSAVLLFILILLGIVLTDKSKRQFVILFSIIAAIIVAFNYLVFPETEKIFLETTQTYFSTVYRIAMLFYFIDDYEKLLKCFRYYSLVIAAFLVGELFLVGVVFNNGRYSMALGYISLLPAMVLVFSFKKNRILLDLVGAVAVIIPIIVYASRGPLLCIALYVVLLVLRDGKTYVKVMAILIAGGVYVGSTSIISALANIIPGLSNSRTFLYFVNNSITEDSGRIGMYKSVIQTVFAHPFTIRGINADYLLLGVYTHNIFLELLYEFGVVIGGIICVWIVVKSIQTYVKSKHSIECEFCMMFMLISLPQLMISHSLWTEWSFWVWVILLFKYIGHSRIRLRFGKN